MFSEISAIFIMPTFCSKEFKLYYDFCNRETEKLTPDAQGASFWRRLKFLYELKTR